MTKIIGGADGPTAIYVTAIGNVNLIPAAAMLAAVIAVLIGCRVAYKYYKGRKKD